ncbi:MAG: NGG1p interacting factor NIF3, partial [Candidatus Aminicenantes bacterium]|nr:NGG1p interacting factor NIF3 [Candidatus Aminicenantes bacterium]
MKLDRFYRKAVEIGVANDLRGREDIDRLLAEEAEKKRELKDEEKTSFDVDRLFNPFADTRILNGDPEGDVRRVMVGIDIEVGELVLAHLLNKESGSKIDLVLSHHPMGAALVQLYEVMKLQSRLLAKYGVTISVAEQLMEKRIGEVER